MEPQHLSLCSKDNATGSEPDEISPHAPNLFPNNPEIKEHRNQVDMQRNALEECTYFYLSALSHFRSV
jgi:hypothetical protein